VPFFDTFSETLLLIAAVAAVWFWADSLKAREIAVRAAAGACAEEGLQFLDETAAVRSLRLARDDEGRLRLRRIYGFEFSDTGDNRRVGSLALLGQEVEWLNLRPQLYLVPKASNNHETKH